MGLEFTANATCDKCRRKTVFKIAIDRLRPQTGLSCKMPEGWSSTSMPESGDLLVTCPSCAPSLVSIPPIPLSEEDVVLDPATDPTLLAPGSGGEE